jgi:hypothetical protein
MMIGMYSNGLFQKLGKEDVPIEEWINEVYSMLSVFVASLRDYDVPPKKLLSSLGNVVSDMKESYKALERGDNETAGLLFEDMGIDYLTAARRIYDHDPVCGKKYYEPRLMVADRLRLLAQEVRSAQIDTGKINKRPLEAAVEYIITLYRSQ